MNNTNLYPVFIASIVSLGGFLFGFDAGIISGVMEYAGPQFNLTDAQWGWAVSCPSFASMFAMLVSGRISDIVGRKKILLIVAFLYALSALLSAYAASYTMLWMARMTGGVAFGMALILAPVYIAEVSTANNRGKLVSLQQLNIVLGFFAAFLCNYYFNKLNTEGSLFLDDHIVWRWMLGIELFPAMWYFIALFFVPESPRWLFLQGRQDEAQAILARLYGEKVARLERDAIVQNIRTEKNRKKVRITELFNPTLRFILAVGLVIGILQQITGINAVYFYATSIFKQTGIGTDAAFSSGVFLSFTTVVFTLVALFLIDRMGRRPLLLLGIAGMTISMSLCAYGFYQATYQLNPAEIQSLQGIDTTRLATLQNIVYHNDVAFKNAVKGALGTRVYGVHEGVILQLATEINATLVLAGILGFIACFAFSLGPVMWVMLSELYPNKYRGLAIGIIGFVNSFASWLVQQVFPWEIATLGSAATFLIFGLVAFAGFFILLRILPETKQKSLEEIERKFTEDIRSTKKPVIAS